MSAGLKFETIGVNIKKGKAEEIATPLNICNDMADLFDYTDCNKKIWMDLYCKTGNTLEALMKHGVHSRNIAAICSTGMCQLFACRKLYGKLLPEEKVGIEVDTLKHYNITRRGQVYLIDGWKDKVKANRNEAYNIVKSVILKEMERTMSLDFDNSKDFGIDEIIMNPPYNNDLYLDFVTVAHKLAKNSVVAITPAKWQAKGGIENEQFRRDVAPYMSKVVYYPDATELFDIAEVDGVCFYTIDRTKKYSKKIIINRFIKNKIFDSTMEREVHGQLNNEAYKIINRIKSCSSKCINVDTTASHFGFNSSEKHGCITGDIQIFSDGKKVGCCDRKNVGKNEQDIEKWKVMVNRMVGYSFFYDEKGMTFGGNKTYILAPNQICGFNYFCLKVCSDKAEAESVQSYYDTKLVRFIMLTSLTTSSIGNEEAFRFVPDPGSFDHIFTDEELYKKYNLTNEEINIIESVIKERK